MAVDLLTLNEGLHQPPDLTIEQVSDIETLKQFCCVLAVGFGMPDSVEGAWFDLFALSANMT